MEQTIGAQEATMGEVSVRERLGKMILGQGRYPRMSRRLAILKAS